MGLELLAPRWLALWILGLWQGKDFTEKGLGGGKLPILWQPGSKEADRKEPKAIQRAKEYNDPASAN